MSPSPKSPKAPKSPKSPYDRKKSSSPKVSSPKIQKATKEGEEKIEVDEDPKKPESSEIPPEKKIDFSQPLWKLYKNKSVLIFKLCSDCGNALFQSKKKFHRSEGRLHLAIGFCDDCLGINIGMTDLISPKH